MYITQPTKKKSLNEISSMENNQKVKVQLPFPLMECDWSPELEINIP